MFRRYCLALVVLSCITAQAQPTQVNALATDRQTLCLATKHSRPISVPDENGAKTRVDQLWNQAEAALEDGQLERAVQTVHEIYHRDPSDQRAVRILRSLMFDSGDLRSKRARSKHRELKWNAGEHVLITTPHFIINTNHTEAEGRRLATLLEETYHIWAQVFVRHWTDLAAVRRAFSDRSLPSPSRHRHRIVFFADRDQYIGHLKKLEPQIELSKGLYRFSDRTAYFYADEALEPYWRHELVHQLLAETGPSAGRTKTAPGEESHAWLVEAIAIYFESLRKVGDHHQLGGFESARLQFARYRMFQEQFYIPAVELASIGREQLKRDPRIRKIYTQSAGLAHFFMDCQNGAQRTQLVELVRRLYQQPKAAARFDLLEGQFSKGIEQQYRDFLDVDDEALKQLVPDGLKSLCLGGTQVTDKSAPAMKPLDQLEWLDLANCDVSDVMVLAISPKAPLRQVALQGTAITDASLEYLARFRTIEELDLSNTTITDAGAEQLTRLSNLRLLWLGGTQITDEAISKLRNLPLLERLETAGTTAAAVSNFGQASRTDR